MLQNRYSCRGMATSATSGQDDSGQMADEVENPGEAKSEEIEKYKSKTSESRGGAGGEKEEVQIVD